MCRVLVLAGILVTMHTGNALAQEIPDFDVGRHCAEQAALFEDSNFMRSACQQQEQSSYDTLKEDWPALASKVKVTCIAQAKSFMKSYFMLNACIQQEVSAGEEVRNFKFKK